MALKQCDKCSEMVDEAKAFCPGCGNAFVEEEKREASKFEKLDPTIQFGHTMYNQLLEDMGLNISNSPNPGEKRVELIAPVSTQISPPAKAPVTVTVPPTVKAPEKSATPSSNLKWYILIGVAVVFLLPFALVSAVLFVLDIWSRLK